MNQYALYFDGWWRVIRKPSIGEAVTLGSYENMEDALNFIRNETGLPVIFPVLTG